jgi:hypothetical protein
VAAVLLTQMLAASEQSFTTSGFRGSRPAESSCSWLESTSASGGPGGSARPSHLPNPDYQPTMMKVVARVSPMSRDVTLEAAPGFEPGYGALQ